VADDDEVDDELVGAEVVDEFDEVLAVELGFDEAPVWLFTADDVAEVVDAVVLDAGGAELLAASLAQAAGRSASVARGRLWRSRELSMVTFGSAPAAKYRLSCRTPYQCTFDR
jgi:hypothetical protein